MKKPLWLVVWLLALELIVVLLLVPGDFTDRAIERESVLVAKSMGVKSKVWIDAKADGWYQSSIVDSGVFDAMYYFLIPNSEQRNSGDAFSHMGGWWFNWVDGRLYAMGKVAYQFYSRIALLFSWFPYMLILFFPAIFDGAMTWHIKRTNFDYASPVIQTYSVRGLFIILIGLFIAFFIPVAIDPAIIPAAMMMCCVFLGLSFGNLQKRV